MSWHNRVIWSEGLFLQPQHMQQQERWIEHLADARSGLGQPAPWGLRRLSLDAQLLAVGKLAVVEAVGILPDGTVFDIPAEDPPPPAIDLDDTVREQTIHLALPLAQRGIAEAGSARADSTQLRWRIGEDEVRDQTTGAQLETVVEVGRLDLRLLLDQDERGGYATLGVARVLECRADKRVVLDDGYIPPLLDSQASPRLMGLVDELLGLLAHRGETLAGRALGSDQAGVAEWADFLLLQVVNRSEPVLRHWRHLAERHPEAWYSALLALAGELATFTRDNKRPAELPPYRHDDLAGSFEPLMLALRDALSRTLAERAISIPIEQRKYGFRLAPLADPTLLAEADFVLAAQARVGAEQLANQFPAQVKVAPPERIQELFRLALPGIGLRPLPVAPRQIPYHAGFVYFELDRNDKLWAELTTSNAFAMHIPDTFPDLRLELWAIRA